jgi:hypothetical protein
MTAARAGSASGASVQTLGCWLAPASAVPLPGGHLCHCLGHGTSLAARPAP